MKTTLTLLLAIFASFTAFGQTTITALPFSITAPGTYTLAADLTSKNVNSVAISISVPAFLTGNLVLNLNGHTIHSNGGLAGMTVSVNSTGYSTTIMNGTFDGFSYGIETASSGNDSHLLIDNVTFKSTSNSTTAILLTRINRAVISRCNFVGVMRCGILDAYSGLGNSYVNLNFDGKQSINIQEGGTDGSSYPYAQTVNFSSTQTQP
jgi:hypothetical protein